jgi:hypothetical protein
VASSQSGSNNKIRFFERQITTTSYTEAPDDQIVSEWVTAETLRQAAKAQLDLSYSDDAAFQAFISDYGMVFAPTPTSDPQPPTEVPTVTPGGPTVTASPEPTLPPPTPTYDGPKAKTEADKMVDTIFSNYQASMLQAGMEGSLTKADFLEALRRQYSHQTLIQRVQAQLIQQTHSRLLWNPAGMIQAIFWCVSMCLRVPRMQMLRHFLPAKNHLLMPSLPKSVPVTILRRWLKLLQRTTQVVHVVARWMSSDKNGQSVAGSMYDMNYVNAAITLKEGEVVTAPVRTQFGWHIIKLDGLNVPTLDEQIRKARTDAYEKWIADQTSQYAVSYNIPATATVEIVATDAPALLPTAPLGGYPTATATLPATATVVAPTATATP